MVDLGLKTSDLGLTSGVGLRAAGEADAGLRAAGGMSSEVLSLKSFLSLAS